MTSGPYKLEDYGGKFVVHGPTLHHFAPMSYVEADQLRTVLNAAYAAGRADADKGLRGALKNREPCPVCGEPLGDWEKQYRDEYEPIWGHKEVYTGRRVRQCCECPFWEDDSEDNNLTEAKLEVARRAEEQDEQVRRTTEATKERMR